MTAPLMFDRNRAIPIQFSRDSSGKVSIDGDWPLIAIIAQDLLNSSTFESGASPDVFGALTNGTITVTCHTGTAIYRAGQLTSEGYYVCELQSASRKAFA